MKSLLPKRIRDLLQNAKNNQEDEPREFASDFAFKLNLQSNVQRQRIEQERGNSRLWKSLTPREQEVVALVCMGKRNYEIGDILGVTAGTAKSHVENILHKVGMRDRHEIRLALVDWDFETWWRDAHR